MERLETRVHLESKDLEEAPDPEDRLGLEEREANRENKDQEDPSEAQDLQETVGSGVNR